MDASNSNNNLNKWILMGCIGFFYGFSIKHLDLNLKNNNVPNYLLRLGVIF
jgi:hypothetical protein